MGRCLSHSEKFMEAHRRYIPGGTFSLNRAIDPMSVFHHANGARMWDVDGNEYLDFHGAFSAVFLGHGDSDVETAVKRAMEDGWSLIGAGSARWEGELAELIVESVPSIEQVQVTNTGTEATFYALRIARAATGRSKVVVMQGGYNGWHDAVSFNLMDAENKLTTRDDALGYELNPITEGISKSVWGDVRAVPFNDLETMERVLADREVAAVIMEPVLQNIGVVKPSAAYLSGVRWLCDKYGTVLVFDEVKTGFRHSLAGYQGVAGVMPDLTTLGKAVANGFPIGVLGGKSELMALCDPAQGGKVAIAGTYNGHPVAVAAAIATISKLRRAGKSIYGRLEELGAHMADGLSTLFSQFGMTVAVARQGSAFTVYFMDHIPLNWRDIAANHDFEMDTAYRKRMVEEGVFHFPLACKQSSLSAAHTKEDVELALARTEKVLRSMDNAAR